MRRLFYDMLECDPLNVSADGMKGAQRPEFGGASIEGNLHAWSSPEDLVPMLEWFALSG